MLRPSDATRRRWDAEAADGALFDNGRQLSALIGRPTTPFSTTVAEALAAVSKA